MSVYHPLKQLEKQQIDLNVRLFSRVEELMEKNSKLKAEKREKMERIQSLEER